MKRSSLLVTLILILSLLLCSCTLGGEGGGESDGEGAGGESAVTIAEAKAALAEVGDVSSTPVTIKATVREVDENGIVRVSDSTGSLDVLLTKGIDAEGKEILFSAIENKPKVKDTVTLKVKLWKLGDSISAYEAVIVSIDAFSYVEMSVADARSAEIGKGIKLTGVVASVTYANGFVPSGFILVDSTSSIYVYSQTAAANVKVGNTVTVVGEKDYWILEDEQVNAQKFGYKGSCQLANASVTANDNLTDGAFDKSWIEETTLMDLLSTPVTENITSRIYKVNALVKEVEDKGFTNFYFFDLDGKTGSYTYTQCNGADFTWLREFDGKICTVYLTALNAKSTSSSCLFRLLPISVSDDGYVFDTADAPKYAVKYHGLTQLKKEYSGDPALTLNTAVSSELLGFEGVTLSFSSNNESVVKFNTDSGITVMNCPGFGTATVTVTATYCEYTYSEDITVTVDENAVVDALTVGDAIDADEEADVTVKGIVGPSIVHANRRGFYLIDSTGIISVSFANSKDLEDIEIGNEVIITGKKITVDGSQICIDNASLVANYYGQNEFPAGTVTENADIANAVSQGNTTAIYKATGTLKVVGTQHYSNYVITIDGIDYTLYASKAATQYAFLTEQINNEVEVLLSVVNWNGKSYKLCALGLITEDGTVYNEYSFAK
ncbi:MAG: hypothetical protein IJY69_02685 [Clostridia bacterium]|nr:hypothetical protein [Clostridia bacterium]